MKKNIQISSFLILCFLTLHCASTSDYYYLKSTIKSGSKIAVLINGANELKNAVLTDFLQAGFDVKAVNAADFYSLEDVFDIKSMKNVAFVADLKDKSTSVNAAILDKMFDNLYKLHIYNFENSKISIIEQLKQKWNLEYIILLEMKDWQSGYNWARAIRLSDMELVYVHNYPASKSDSYQSITSKLIKTIQGEPSMKRKGAETVEKINAATTTTTPEKK